MYMINTPGVQYNLNVYKVIKLGFQNDFFIHCIRNKTLLESVSTT